MTSSLGSFDSQRLIPYISGEQLRAAITPTVAVNALQTVLESGLDPETDARRTRVATNSGLFLQMPSTWKDAVGTKLLTITETNALIEKPVIQGLYVIFGGIAQAPRAILDGIELTNLRTSAVSALGARFAASSETRELLVFGTGVQAWAHIETFAHVFKLSTIRVVGRNPDNTQVIVDRAKTELGLDCFVGTAADVSRADLIVCCTASSDPLFDGSLVRDHTVVVAMGAHEPSSREVDDGLLHRSNVIVESRDSALREAGDIMQALESGALADAAALMTLSEAFSESKKLRRDRPTVFKTTGMPWQDLIIASAVLDALHKSNTHSEEIIPSNV